jgi:hypothetical protein
VSAAELPGLRLLLAAKVRFTFPDGCCDSQADEQVLVGLAGKSGRKILRGDASALKADSAEEMAAMHLAYWRAFRRLPRGRSRHDIWWAGGARVGLEHVCRLCVGEPVVIHLLDSHAVQLPHRSLLVTLARTATLVKPDEATVGMLKSAMCKASLRAL